MLDAKRRYPNAHSLTSLDRRKIVARTSTKLTPAQLEEFESTFRHFDRDQTNTLGFPEFTAALSALGIIYSDEDTLAIHRQLSELDQEGMEGRVTFQAFVDFLVRGKNPLSKTGSRHPDRIAGHD